MDLFSHLEEHGKKNKIGNCQISYKEAGSILTPASGFMEEYDYTLNPYSGCSFGCTYCYAAFFSRSEEQRKNWGLWLQVKENSLHLLKKFRTKSLTNKTIYISSVTDPYQPIEKEIEITKSILSELADYHQPRIVIQTRSPLVTRDIQIFQQFQAIQINMTITTDSEDVRKIFEPYCPANENRLAAIKEVNDAGITTCITMTPLLPIINPEAFAIKLKESGIENFIVQPFHSEKGKFVAGTRAIAMALINELNWTKERYQETEAILIKHLPNIGIGKDGFKPI